MNQDIASYLDLLNQFDRRAAEFEAEMIELSLHEYRVLAAIAREPLIIKDVAHKRSVAPQGVGRQVERLRARGLVSVERYERDKRAKIARVTETGRATLDRGETILERVLSRPDESRVYSADGVAQRA